MSLLGRNTGSVPNGSEFRLKSFRTAKFTALALAALAVAIGSFDLLNIAVVETATEFINKTYTRAIESQERMRSQFDRVPNLVVRAATIGTAQAVAVAALTAATHSAKNGAMSGAKTGALLRPDASTPAAAANSNLLHARLPSPAALMHLTASTLGRAKQCLANAIYFEARNEPVRGQIAVAQVVINRVFSGYYPNDLCDVVYQNASRHLDCQFTFACDGKRNVINERGAWARAQQIASQVLAGDLYDQAVGSSTHYHALYVRPDWVQEMKKLARYGTHNFYRPVSWGDGADAPVWGIVPLPLDKSKAQ